MVPERLPTDPRWRVVVSGFILACLFILVGWNLPPSGLASLLRARLAPIVRLTGLEQRWMMFVHPDRSNIYLRARITSADGTQRFWPFGRMSHRSFWEKLLHERERKVSELIWNPKKGWSKYYPQIARWAARHHAHEPSNPPVKVELMVRWSPIPKPPGGLRQDPLVAWRSEVIYTADMPPEALQ